MTFRIYSNRRDENPALCLHNYWHNMFKALKGDEGVESGDLISLGSTTWGVRVADVEDDGPTLRFGRLNYSNLMDLRANGEFRLSHLWGYEQRSAIAGNTFLAWGHRAGAYQWYVDLDHSNANNWNCFADHQNPKCYLSEPIIGNQSWRWDDNPWLRVEPAGSQWKIVHAVGTKYLSLETLNARRERYEALVARRYLAHENAERVARGELPRTPSNPSGLRGKVTKAGEAITGDEAVMHIAARLDVRAPAKSTPLPRMKPEEATDDHMVPRH